MATAGRKKTARKSLMEVNSNPFEAAGNGQAKPLAGPGEYESLSDTVKIGAVDFDEIVSALEKENDNSLKIKALHIMKTPYLFSSEQLITLLHVTPSVKTRISFVTEIGPRLVDPKAKSAKILELFRYSDEKKQVEEVLKSRAQKVTKSTFSRGSVLQNNEKKGGGRGAGRGGRGGTSKSSSMRELSRGGGGRGNGATRRVASARTTSAPSQIEKESSSFPSTLSKNSDVQDEKSCKESDSPKPPVWNPPPRRESFLGPEIVEITTPTDNASLSVTGVSKPVAIAVRKRFSNTKRISLVPISVLSSIGDTVNEDNSDEDNEEEKVNEEASLSGKISEVDEQTIESSIPPATEKRRRESTFCAPNSVLSALGYDDLQDLSTDDIGKETWDVKARSKAEGNEVTLVSEAPIRKTIVDDVAFTSTDENGKKSKGGKCVIM